VSVPKQHSGDPYEILGVSRQADAREIRTAYRRLAKSHHPDLNPAPDAAEQMARINWAYNVALEHVRHDGHRVYRPTGHRPGPRFERRWFVRQRPAPAGGRLVVQTRSILLRAQRGDNPNVEGIVLVHNEGTGPLDGEARTLPSYMIVRPKHFTLAAGEAQMFRVTVPNRYCESTPTEGTLLFETNGGDDRVQIAVPATADVVLSIEPGLTSLGPVEAGSTSESRLRLSYRGVGLPRLTVEPDVPWLTVRALSLPRRTQYFRLIVTAPLTPGIHNGRVVVHGADATAAAVIRLTVGEAVEA
jgi:hypothetical protein